MWTFTRKKLSKEMKYELVISMMNKKFGLPRYVMLSKITRATVLSTAALFIKREDHEKNVTLFLLLLCVAQKSTLTPRRKNHEKNFCEEGFGGIGDKTPLALIPSKKYQTHVIQNIFLPPNSKIANFICSFVCFLFLLSK